MKGTLFTSWTHLENDKAVMQAYGFPKDLTESDIVAELFKRYKVMTEKEK